MPAPSPSFNTVAVYGTWKTLKGDPIKGKIRFTVNTRVVSITDNLIFPAGTVFEVPLGVTSGSMSVDLPAVDDPDNFPDNWSIKVEEVFDNGVGLTYSIQPTVAMAVGGLNLRTIVTPAQAADQVYTLYRSIPGGVAGLDADGDVINAAGVKVTGGGGGTSITSYDTIAQLPNYPSAFAPLIGAAANRAVAGNDARLTDTRTPTDGTVTNIKVATNAAISLDKTADSATRVAMLATERSKLTGVALNATANQTDAQLHDAAALTGIVAPARVADGTLPVAKLIAAELTAAINTRMATIVGTAPSTLDTLAEIDAALNNDPNFATTITSALALKAPLASPTLTNPTFTGTVIMPDGALEIADTNSLSARLDRPKYYYNGTAWPTTRPTSLWPGYSGPVVWDSEDYPDTTAPPSAICIAGDRYDYCVTV